MGADRPRVGGLLVRQAGPARHLPPHLGHLRLDHQAGLQPPLLLMGQTCKIHSEMALWWSEGCSQRDNAFVMVRAVKFSYVLTLSTLILQCQISCQYARGLHCPGVSGWHYKQTRITSALPLITRCMYFDNTGTVVTYGLLQDYLQEFTLQ